MVLIKSGRRFRNLRKRGRKFSHSFLYPCLFSFSLPPFPFPLIPSSYAIISIPPFHFPFSPSLSRSSLLKSGQRDLRGRNRQSTLHLLLWIPFGSPSHFLSWFHIMMSKLYIRKSLFKCSCIRADICFCFVSFVPGSLSLLPSQANQRISSYILV